MSDDELIELLDLALSSDTTNTVRRARELMGSAIDPLQLVSQLANLIMDILSGRCQSAVTEVSKSFLGRYACTWPFLDIFFLICYMNILLLFKIACYYLLRCLN